MPPKRGGKGKSAAVAVQQPTQQKDELDVWLDKIEELHDNPAAQLIKVNRCCVTYQFEPHYRNDARYIRLWIAVADSSEDPCATFRLMQRRGIGVKLALYWAAWGVVLNAAGNVEAALQKIQEGLDNKAEPKNLLEDVAREMKEKARAAQTAATNASTTGAGAARKGEENSASSEAPAGRENAVVKTKPRKRVALAPLSPPDRNGAGKKRLRTEGGASAEHPETKVEYMDTTTVGTDSASMPQVEPPVPARTHDGRKKEQLVAKKQEEIPAIKQEEPKQQPKARLERTSTSTVSKDSTSMSQVDKHVPIQKKHDGRKKEQLVAKKQEKIPAIKHEQQKKARIDCSDASIVSKDSTSMSQVDKPVPIQKPKQQPKARVDDRNTTFVSRDGASMSQVDPPVPMQKHDGRKKEQLVAKKQEETKQQPKARVKSQLLAPPPVKAKPEPLPSSAEHRGEPKADIEVEVEPETEIEIPAADSHVDKKQHKKQRVTEDNERLECVSVEYKPPVVHSNPKESLLVGTGVGSGSSGMTIHPFREPHRTQMTTESEEYMQWVVKAADMIHDMGSDHLKGWPKGKSAAGTTAHAHVESEAQLGHRRVRVQGLLGEGAYARVYRCCLSSTGEPCAVKVERPACSLPWEFYISHQVRERLQGLPSLPPAAPEVLPKPGSPVLLRPRQLYTYGDGCAMPMRMGHCGTLHDLTITHLKKGSPIPECIVAYYGAEMCRCLRAVHKAGVLHCDIKPDNWLLTIRNNGGACAKNVPPLADYTVSLIDFGRAIDLRAYGSECAGFVCGAQHAPDGFSCPEMHENLPWKHQLDLCGFASTLHFLLHKEPMTMFRHSKDGKARWKPKTRLKRYWSVTMWEYVFDILLNEYTLEDECDTERILTDVEGALLRFTHADDKKKGDLESMLKAQYRATFQP